jgi:hypothetical protein
VAIYKVENKQLSPIERTSFDKQGILEREHLQSMLRDQIEIISPDTLIVSEEFGEWEGSKRRIDLLGIDKAANLVVIELKRTEDGGHMELQALRYSAMISTMTFGKLVQIYDKYLKSRELELDAEKSILDFLDWEEPDEDSFAQEVKIVLASAEFSKELTTTVLWLNDYGLDIQCVRMHPYVDGGRVLLDIQTVIPVPETADYQVKIREKKQQERVARSQSRDLTKYHLEAAGKTYNALNKRRLVHQVVTSIIESGEAPSNVESITTSMPGGKSKIFTVFEGELNEGALKEQIMKDDSGGIHARTERFFCKDGEFYHSNGKTYVLTNQWGNETIDTINELIRSYPQLNISYEAV